MSGYRQAYVPWNKTGASGGPSTPTPTKKEPLKYESGYTSGRTRPDVKKTDDKTGAGKFPAYSGGYQRDTSAPRDTGNIPSKLSEISARYNKDKKDTSHPPVTYRTLARTGARSRDPSPVEKSDSSSYNFNSKLYQKPYTPSTARGISRERTDSTSSTTIPKYTGRSSLTKDDFKYPLGTRERTESTSSSTTIPKYSGRTSLTKDDYRGKEVLNKYKDDTLKVPLVKDSTIPKYTGRLSSSKDDPIKYSTSRLSTTKDDPPKYSGRLSASKDDPPKYSGRLNTDIKYSASKTNVKEDSKFGLGRTSRNPSREDLSTKYKSTSSSGSEKTKSYITSRFLPKNSVEKSYTAYSRPSTSKTSEISRKNRELLNVIAASQYDTSRPSSRCSSIGSLDDSTKESAKEFHKEFKDIQSKEEAIEEIQEYETITVVTRSTSPNPPGSNVPRTRRLEVARLIEKQISRPKNRGPMSDKEIQSDRLDDTTKSSRFAGSSRISATPWSSFLDVKYSSPGSSKKDSDSCPSTPRMKPKNSNNSEKSNSRKTPPKAPKEEEQKKLPPPVPRSDSTSSNSGGLNSLNTPNKDFRKSILNMSPEEYKKKNSKRSTSVSSAEEDGSEATEISENLSSCKSYPTKTSSSSKLPQSTENSRSRRSGTRSPSLTSDTSSSSSAATSGSEDDSKKLKSKKESSKKESKLKKLSGSSRSGDENQDKSLKPPLSPRVKTDSDKSEAKSFLMRALAPVTNLFKGSKGQGESVVVEKSLCDDSSENISDIKTDSSSKEERKRTKLVITRVESADNAWWLDTPPQETSQKSASPKSVREDSKSSGKQKPVIKILHRVESGEKAWWLTPDADIPEGVTVYPVAAEETVNEDGQVCYTICGDEQQEPEYVQRYKIRHIDSGERPWWLSSSENIPEGVTKWEDPNAGQQDTSKSSSDGRYVIKPMKTGEKAWWLGDEEIEIETPKPQYQQQEIVQYGEEEEGEEESENEMPPLGDRASPEGLEMPKEEEEGRLSPYDNVPVAQSKPKRPSHLFISRHTNIDDILGGASQLYSPLMDRIFTLQDLSSKQSFDEPCEEVTPGQVRIHDSTAQHGIIQPTRLDALGSSQTGEDQLDDAALQLYKDGDYGSYLDLEASISEQQEEFEGFQSNKKNSIVLRTQLSVRVHTIIEKLYNSEGRELRRALFSLKQIFQEDKDLVHEFVQNDGLSCLIKVGSEADQNYQNYILRALGQVMLYVDGMNGVMEHNKTVQWLYSLISSKFRLVVKTALKLLLVFVEYTDSNCMLLIKAIHTVDCSQGFLPWYNIMRLLKDFDSADTELLIYATTLINKCLNGIPDQDTYYDQTDALEEQGIEAIIQRYMSKPGTDLDLLQQFQIYEAVLQYEDGEDKGTPIRHLDESIRKTLRSRKSVADSAERRKSRRHSTGTTPVHSALNNNIANNNFKNISLQSNLEDDDESSSSHSDINSNLNGSYKENNKAHEAGVTPALRRRRERAERQRSFMREQETATLLSNSPSTNIEDSFDNENGTYTNGLQQRLANGNLNRSSSRKDLTPLLNAVNKLDSEDNSLNKQPWILSMMYNKSNENENDQENEEDVENANENERNLLLQLKRENTVKDLTQKLANQNILSSPSSEENKVNRIGDMSGLISKAKEGLAKSKSQANVLKSPTGENVPKIVEVKKSENELRWEELVANMNRPLNLCDMDFTDLASDDEADVLTPVAVSNGIPPPPPPLLRDNGIAPPPPPLVSSKAPPPPVPSMPMFGLNCQRVRQSETKIPIKKNKKTVKLFWKEVRDDPVSSMKLKGGYIWDELSPVTVDTQKLEHLFESRAKDLITKKQQEMNKNKEIIVLDPKRSNAINIGMTKLPPPRSIKTAILKMDATIMNREGIEKLLTMLPTEEERSKIQEAQAANPDLPLGSAEQFLLTLASISELPARLKLWAFKLDFENTEREIAEPLMDLKQGFELLRTNKTFRGILSTLLSIGNFLNGNEVKGFQIEYLSKVPEVKDTVHKHSLLHHLCHIVMEKFPDATDLYSEIGAITRASKVDFDELTLNIQRLEADCKASWDHLKLIAKHDGSTMMKVKMSDFLADCAERIILVGIIHRRVMNRFHKFLLWLGIPLHQISETKPNEFCRIVSEFSLEYRTTRERVLQQLEKKANHRERNKTRGKMITESGKFKTKEDRADAELRQLLGSDISDVESMQGTLPWRRTKRDSNRFLGQLNGNLTDGDDEILESLVKTATKAPTSRTAPRERKRTRHADRKSLKRSRTRENNPFGSRDSP